MSIKQPPESKTDRLSGWGHSLMGKLPACSRKRRKRGASKKRRVVLRGLRKNHFTAEHAEKRRGQDTA